MATHTTRSAEAIRITESLALLRAPNNTDNTVGYVEQVVLVANTSQQVTVPATATMAFFSGNVDFFAAYGSNPTAVVPSSSTTDGSGNELNPTARHFGLGEVAKIALISAAGGIVTINFVNS